jgi:DNA (cytosine-5)-methyltransferase 1
MTPNPKRLNELALFAGAGGGILGGKLIGWKTICAVEWDAYARDVLVARQNDGCLDPFPIWDDVQTFDGRPWRGRVDVVSGGFPCQDISAAGKGAGIEGERSGMWKHMARIVGEVRPRFVLVENSPMLVGRGLGMVLGDLAEMGYDARWGIVGAHHAAAPHKRDRIWIVAYDPRSGRGAGRSGRSDPSNTRKSEQPLQAVADAMRERSEAGTANPAGRQEGNARKPLNGGADMADAASEREHGKPGDAGREGIPWNEGEQEPDCGGRWWATEPDVGGKTDGMAAKLDGHKAHD